MAKNFTEYARKRIGLTPRPLSLNNSETIIEKIISKKKNSNCDVVVTEFGFNHGNDSRHIIRLLLDKLGETGWQFWGFDHKDYFMPENIFYGFSEAEVRVIKSNARLFPCYFEDLAVDATLLPSQIDYCYSNKSLSMVQRDYFYILMDQISTRVSDGGFMCCSLHVYSPKDPTYFRKDDYIDMLEGKVEAPISCGMMFEEFESIADFTDQKYFSFISEKNGRNGLVMQKGISNNESELLYENVFYSEKKI